MGVFIGRTSGTDLGTLNKKCIKIFWGLRRGEYHWVLGDKSWPEPWDLESQIRLKIVRPSPWRLRLGRPSSLKIIDKVPRG